MTPSPSPRIERAPPAGTHWFGQVKKSKIRMKIELVFILILLPGRRVMRPQAPSPGFACLAAGILLASTAHAPAGAPPTASRPFGIDKYIPVTTSTVIGSPDPPPPYRVQRLFPKLKLSFPICVRPQPGTDLMLVIDEQQSYGPTRLGRVRDHPDSTEIETLLTMDDVAYDVVFHPRYAENGYLYVGSNGAHPSGKKRTRVTRYLMDRKPPYRLDPKSATVIIDWDSDGHNGGAIAFGSDGLMFVTSGDGTSDSDTNLAGQDMTRLLSKVLRIDVDHPAPGKMYSVPGDNPFVGRDGIRPETWAYGLRNPWRMTFDAKSGQLWVGQNGQDLWEQAYLVKPGENYGWSVMEGSHEFYPNRKPGPTPIVKPTVEHHHSEFRSLTGGVVYRGSKYPELDGAYLYGDYSTGKIWAGMHDGTRMVWNRELADSHLAVTWIGRDTRGELIVADHRGDGKGGFYTLVPSPQTAKSSFPRKLSDSGLFESVSGRRLKAGAIPYSVNAPFWSDGAHKERWLVLPGESPRIEFSHARGWNFPDRTVLVKSFALEAEAGNPRSRQWIETRFLTKQNGEWYGYSYQWNDEQTDAVLVERGGADREFVFHSPRGERRQKWHYPSRAECMVCHSRAANFVLGLSELQMNRDHDYGGVVDNQLRVLEHLGLVDLKPLDDIKARLRDEARDKSLTGKQADEYVEKETSARLKREPIDSSGKLTFSESRYKRLVDPYDGKQDLDRRARSFLHANCSQCHVEAGGGNAQMDLEFTTEAAKTRIFNVKPVHHTFGIADARLIAPGHPERSVLLQRISHRGEGQMPPLATEVVDREAVELLRQWIQKLN
jgi:glucose/arabinose dehydrogenase/mono/diheme cytochrome c family protein